MTRKSVPFKWVYECEKNHQKLNIVLTIAPVLVLPLGIGIYMVYCDSSCIGLGTILIQDGRAVNYALRCLKIQ